MKKFVVFTLVIIILIVGFIIMNNTNDIVEASSSESSTVKKSSNAGITPKKKETKDTKNEVTRIKVDIKGSVVSPDVYEVDSNSRVIDQTTPNMIQGICGIFARNPLISSGL